MRPNLKLVTVCLSGEAANDLKLNGGHQKGDWPAGGPDFNRRKLEQLSLAIARIGECGWQPDVILLPGGFLALPKNEYVGDLEPRERISAISGFQFNAEMITQSKTSGAAIIAGVDGPPKAVYRDRGDQLCCVWDAAQDALAPIAVARKVFPDKSETEQNSDGNRLLVYANDYETNLRLFDSRGKGTGLLCVCYDLYGCRDLFPTDAHARYVNRLSLNGSVIGHGRGRLRYELAELLQRWHRLVSQADAIFTCIHGFSRRHCGMGYWTTHAFQGSSLALPTVPIVGAAHFARDQGLPRSPQSSTFVALGGDSVEPDDYFYQQGVLARLHAIPFRANEASVDQRTMG